MRGDPRTNWCSNKTRIIRVRALAFRERNLPLGMSFKELFWEEELPPASLPFHTAKAFIPQAGDSPLSLTVEHCSFIWIKILFLPCNGNASWFSQHLAVSYLTAEGALCCIWMHLILIWYRAVLFKEVWLAVKFIVTRLFGDPDRKNDHTVKG